MEIQETETSIKNGGEFGNVVISETTVRTFEFKDKPIEIKCDCGFTAKLHNIQKGGLLECPDCGEFIPVNPS